ncbi:MAG: YdhR family protein, partial [Chloroflexota bacterium]
MSGMFLQVNFKFNMPPAEFEGAASTLANQFAAVPGLTWKVWFINESESEAGGIYYFKDEASLKIYLDSELAAGVIN